MGGEKQANTLASLESNKGVHGLVIVGLYVIGLLHWLLFFYDFDTGAWAKQTGGDWFINSAYYGVLRDAIHHVQLPLLMDFMHFTDRFLGLPHTPLSPQFLLLSVLDDGLFNILNVLILHTVCFGGLLLIKRDHNLSSLPFIFLCLLYEFNGHIVAHLSVGHFMWCGYFFMPYAHWLLLRILKKPSDERARILLAIALFFLLLQGGFHLLIYWIIFLSMVALIRPRLMKAIFYVLVLTVGLNLFRFLPSAASLQETELGFKYGYPSVVWLFEALLFINPPDWAGEIPHMHKKWWELNSYVGIAGFLLLGYFGVVKAFFNKERREFRALDYACLCMALLSIGGIVGTIATYFPIPLFTSQRVASRLFILPLTTCIVLGSLRMEDTLQKNKNSMGLRMVLVLLLSITTFELFRHTLTWQVAHMDAAFDKLRAYTPPNVHLILEPDMNAPGMQLYVNALLLGSLATLAFFAFAIFRYRRAGKLDT